MQQCLRRSVAKKTDITVLLCYFVVQVLRGSERECPHRFWPPAQNRTCYAFENKRYVLEVWPADFGTARRECEAMRGALAELSVKGGAEEQRFLALIVPPDGTCIGLQPGSAGDPRWTWIGSDRKVSVWSARGVVSAMGRYSALVTKDAEGCIKKR